MDVRSRVPSQMALTPSLALCPAWLWVWMRLDLLLSSLWAGAGVDLGTWWTILSNRVLLGGAGRGFLHQGLCRPPPSAGYARCRPLRAILATSSPPRGRRPRRRLRPTEKGHGFAHSRQPGVQDRGSDLQETHSHYHPTPAGQARSRPLMVFSRSLGEASCITAPGLSTSTFCLRKLIVRPYQRWFVLCWDSVQPITYFPAFYTPQPGAMTSGVLG